LKETDLCFLERREKKNENREWYIFKTKQKTKHEQLGRDTLGVPNTTMHCINYVQ